MTCLEHQENRKHLGPLDQLEWVDVLESWLILANLSDVGLLAVPAMQGF